MNLRSYSIIHKSAKLSFVITSLVLCVFLFPIDTARAEGEFLLSIGDKYQIPCLSQTGSEREYEILIENPDIVGLDETGKCIIGVSAGTTEVTVILYDPGAVYAYVFTVSGYDDRPTAAFNDGIDSAGSEWDTYESTGEYSYYGAGNADTSEQNGWEDAAENNSGQIIKDDTDSSNSGQTGGNDSDGSGYGQSGGSDIGGNSNEQSGRSDIDESGNRHGDRNDIDESGNGHDGRNNIDAGSSETNSFGYSTTRTESYPGGNGEFKSNTGTADHALSNEVTDCPVFFSHGTGKYDILVPSHYTLWISVRSRRSFAILYVGADGMPIPYRMEKSMIYIKSDDIPKGHHLIQVIAANSANKIFDMVDYHIYR